MNLVKLYTEKCRQTTCFLTQHFHWIFSTREAEVWSDESYNAGLCTLSKPIDKYPFITATYNLFRS
jgi:hypothetical protein